MVSGRIIPYSHAHFDSLYISSRSPFATKSLLVRECFLNKFPSSNVVVDVRLATITEFACYLPMLVSSYRYRRLSSDMGSNSIPALGRRNVSDCESWMEWRGAVT